MNGAVSLENKMHWLKTAEHSCSCGRTRCMYPPRKKRKGKKPKAKK